MKPTKDVIDTTGEVIETTVRPLPDAENSSVPSAEQHFNRPLPEETMKVEMELAELETRWRSTQLVRMLIKTKVGFTLLDPEVRQQIDEEELFKALLIFYHTPLNLIIGLLDAVGGGVGETGSGGSDVMKGVKLIHGWLKKHGKFFKKKFPWWLDPAPDVPISVAWGSEVLEPFTGGFIPTHLMFELPIQFHHDLNRVISVLKQAARAKAKIDDGSAEAELAKQLTKLLPASENEDE